LNSHSIKPGSIIKLAKGYRLQWEKTQDSFVLLFPEGIITLNECASDILKVCINNTVEYGLEKLTLEYEPRDEILNHDVYTFLEQAKREGWISVEY